MLGFIPWWKPSNWGVLCEYGILRTDIKLFLREILLSTFILAFNKSEYSQFEVGCFLLWTVWAKNWFSGLPEKESDCSLVIITASTITNNDVKIKEIISNFCRPSGLAACRSCMSFALVYQLGKRKIWDWLLAVWGSPSTCLRALKSSLSFLEARVVNRGLGLVGNDRRNE